VTAQRKSKIWSLSLAIVSIATSVIALGFALASFKSLDWLHFRNKPTDALVLSIKNAAGEPVTDAIVKLDYIDSVFAADSAGTIRFTKLATAHLKGSIYAPGYEDVSLDLTVPAESRLVNEILTREPKVSISSDPGDQWSDSPLQPYVEEVRSGPRPSGIGSNFSGWYELHAPRPKPGYEIDLHSIQFSLSGDRQCNSWSECQLVQASPTEVRLLFRLQGLSEWRQPQPAYSEAVLRLHYVPIMGTSDRESK